MKLLFSSFLLLSACALRTHAAPSPSPASETISSAVRQMYNSKFELSRETLSAYSTAHPKDPLASSLRAASYLFSELDRGGALVHDLLKDDRTIAGAKTGHVDPVATAALNMAATQTRQEAAALLARNPHDTNALLALCIVSGVQRDYLALVQHRLRESYEYIKESQDYASRLLVEDPTAYDAYVTKGFTEYLVASLPFYLRWPMKLDNVSGTKQQGLDDLRVAAKSGQYLRPFAQLLLAMFYLREKQQPQTERLLAQLAHDYPDNPAFGLELRKLELRRSGPN